MGYLDHSTNNIILDAVLTDRGRELLSRNDGSFQIVKFALSDDEVDYTTIQKFGRTVGKEKIEKNTPVFEALTNGSIAQKFPLRSISIGNLIRLPSLDLDGVTSDTITLNMVNTRTQSVTVKQSIGGDSLVPIELVDQVFKVVVNNLFLQISGQRPVSISKDNIATYLITRAATLDTVTGGSSVAPTVQIKSSLTTTMFSTYGIASDKSTIRSYITITGQQSGASKNLLVKINKTS
tara:strand:+ start:950 stop:1657 length:708 start_codon:yes stop_codon:yes gene_type:complete